MANKIPPFVTPFALFSIVLALGATNVVVNHATHTSEGARVSSTSSVSRRMDSDDSSSVSRSSSQQDESEQQSSSTRSNNNSTTQ